MSLAHRIIIETGNVALKKEPSMHRFAGAFLIPREHLEEEAGRNRHGMTWIEIMRLKRTYEVSPPPRCSCGSARWTSC